MKTKSKSAQIRVPKPFAHWMDRVQRLIQLHSTEPRKSGKYKGHSSTDASAWIADLTKEVQADIRRCSKGAGYDENMALASTLGAILFVWYANVHRAKCYDPNRPIEARQHAYEQRKNKIAILNSAIHDDVLMTGAFPGQHWNLPYGLNAYGGRFV